MLKRLLNSGINIAVLGISVVLFLVALFGLLSIGNAQKPEIIDILAAAQALNIGDTIISLDGNPFNTAKSFYIYYVTTPRDVTRWHNTNFERMTVTLSGQMLEPSHGWEFNIDVEGWKPLYNMDTFEIQNSALIIQATGNDPYMASPSLGINGDTYKKIEIRMKTGQSGIGQFFFTTKEFPYHVEETSVAFNVDTPGEYATYTVDMSASENWKGIIGDIRFDPIDHATTIEIDYIQLVP